MTATAKQIMAQIAEAQEKLSAPELKKYVDALTRPPFAVVTDQLDLSHALDAGKYFTAMPMPPPPSSSVVTPRWSNYDKLMMRLNIEPGGKFDIDHVHIFGGPNKTFVFMVHGEEVAFIEDDTSIFPSDAFIAKYRLVASGLKK